MTKFFNNHKHRFYTAKPYARGEKAVGRGSCDYCGNTRTPTLKQYPDQRSEKRFCSKLCCDLYEGRIQ